jgi:hypothetical protein
LKQRDCIGMSFDVRGGDKTNQWNAGIVLSVAE